MNILITGHKKLLPKNQNLVVSVRRCLNWEKKLKNV